MAKTYGDGSLRIPIKLQDFFLLKLHFLFLNTKTSWNYAKLKFLIKIRMKEIIFMKKLLLLLFLFLLNF